MLSCLRSCSETYGWPGPRGACVPHWRDKEPPDGWEGVGSQTLGGGGVAATGLGRAGGMGRGLSPRSKGTGSSTTPQGGS